VNVTTSLDPASSSAVPGAAAATHTLRVRNGGDTVEEYQLSVVGPLAPWAVLAPDRLRLYPGDEGTATITITVPRTSKATAGPTPFGVRVVPRVNAELSDVAEGTVSVAPFGELRADMNPVTVRGRLSAALQLTVDNRGNAPLHVRLDGRDDEDVLRFDEQDEPVQVPPGVTGNPPLRVRPRRRRFTGRSERFPFSVTVTPADPDAAAGAQPVQLRGTYVRLALIPTWLLLALIALLLAAAVAAGLLYLPFTNLQRFVFPQPPPVVVAAPNVQPPQQVQPPAPQPAQQAPQQVQPPPPPEQNQGGQNQNLTVTIAHGDLALTAVDNPRGDGSPAPVVGPRNAGQETGRIWTLLQLQDGSVAIVPAATGNRVLEQPNPVDNSQLGLTDVSGNNQLAASQTWFLQPADGGFTIVNSGTRDCLTDIGEGRPVVGSPCGLGDAQTWEITQP
jgi:hypothetical protein